MNIKIPNIFQGQAYATTDGDVFTVMDLNLKSGQAVIEDQDDCQGVIDLDDLLQAIRNGKFILIEEEDEVVDEPEGSEELEETDEHDND